jgi:hypothetical protein
MLLPHHPPSAHQDSKNGSTETIRVPTADHLNTIRALEGYLAAPEKIEMDSSESMQTIWL